LEFNQSQGPEVLKKVELVTYNDDFVVIRDKFPKGLVHWLVLPRKEMIEEIGLLDNSHLPMLRKMQTMEEELKALAVKETGDERLELWSGFHSWPSMKLLHLHLISADLNGPRLTSVSHWISFTTSFFIRLPTLIARIEEAGNPQIDLAAEKKLKRGKPTCPICQRAFHASEKGVIEAKLHYQTCRNPTPSSTGEES
jgi:aprataxin